jgi:hypothetical protein
MCSPQSRNAGVYIAIQVQAVERLEEGHEHTLARRKIVLVRVRAGLDESLIDLHIASYELEGSMPMIGAPSAFS